MRQQTPPGSYLVVSKAMAVSHPHEAWCRVPHCVQATRGGGITQLWHAGRGTEKEEEAERRRMNGCMQGEEKKKRSSR